MIDGKAPWPLYLFGQAGTGKTSGALVALDHCGQRKGEKYDRTPLPLRDWWYGYTEARNVATMKINSGNGWFCDFLDTKPKFTTWPVLLERWERLPLVVIDEIGVGKTDSDFRLDALIELVNTRCREPRRPLIVTGNIWPTEVEKLYDDRFASRILTGTVIEVKGEDRRLRK